MSFLPTAAIALGNDPVRSTSTCASSRCAVSAWCHDDCQSSPSCPRTRAESSRPVRRVQSLGAETMHVRSPRWDR